MHVEANKVFFSYARADAEFVLSLAKDLRAAGVDLWIDQLDIPPGVKWDQAVEDALEACPCFLVVLSPASVSSDNVMDEASFAIEQGKKILPVLYQNCDIPFRLKRLQYIDFSGDYDGAYTKLLNTLRTHFQDNAREALSAKPDSGGMSLDSASTAAHKVESAAVRTRKNGESWWVHPRWIGAIAMIIVGALASPYLYDLFTSNNGLPTIQTSELEQELLKANIILSESEGAVQDVRTWITSEPSYQVLAQNCLKALAGKRVIDPVPLDVINGWYMEALGYSPDQYIPPSRYDDLAKLRQAIFDTWKQRHTGSAQNSFDEIVQDVSTSH